MPNVVQVRVDGIQRQHARFRSLQISKYFIILDMNGLFIYKGQQCQCLSNALYHQGWDIRVFQILV
jgi:hypothetical protein